MLHWFHGQYTRIREGVKPGRASGFASNEISGILAVSQRLVERYAAIVMGAS